MITAAEARKLAFGETDITTKIQNSIWKAANIGETCIKINIGEAELNLIGYLEELNEAGYTVVINYDWLAQQYKVQISWGYGCVEN